MKKIIIQVLAILLMLEAYTYTAYATGESNRVEIQNASADMNTVNQVIISGNISSGQGQMVTVLITDSANKVEYFNSAMSTENGAFTFTYTLANSATGKYNVKLSGNGVKQPTNISFDYKSVSENKEELGVVLSDINVSINGSNVVVRGRINSNSRKQITLAVSDSNQKPIYINSKVSNNHGEFSFPFPMNGNSIGRYKIKLSGQGVINPVISSFTYGIDSNDAALINLLFKNGTWGKRISIDKAECTVNIPADIDYLTIMPGTSDVCSTVKIGNKVIKGWAESENIPLSTGRNLILLTVTAPDGIAVNNYQLNIVKGYTLTNVSAKIDNDKHVTISGSINSSYQKDITVVVTDPNNKKDYINSLCSTNDGKFNFSYPMQNNTEGTYHVIVGGTQAIEAVTTSFEYTRPKTELQVIPTPTSIPAPTPTSTPTPTLYSITVDSEETAYLTPSVVSAEAGTTITLTCNPPQGLTLDHLEYVVGNDAIVINGNSFIMPAVDIMVRAIFQ